MLVDEVNRATPKTQSALLEAMAEQQVTVDGVTRELPDPFLLLATENPIEYEGTFPLPEAQLDRFFLKTALGYPSAEDELQVLEEQRFAHPLARSSRPSRSTTCTSCVPPCSDVYVDDVVRRWIVDLVRATRDLDDVAMGASVRGSLALERAARAWALLHGRDFVVPDDVERLFVPVILHRLVFTSGFLARARARGGGDALEELRHAVPRARPRARLRGRPALRGPAARAAALRRHELSPSPAGEADRPLVRDHAERSPRDRARTSPARGRTSRATTSTRSTGPRRRGCPRRVSATSSSSASASPRRRRASSSSATAARAWRPSDRRSRGSTRRRRCGTRLS